MISGSTRLKAGTATKLVLNMLTTGAMVLLGKTYGNLMVDLKATNTKLVVRTRRIVAELTGLSEAEAEQQLARCGGELKTAVVAHRHGVSAEEARRLLHKAGGQLRVALNEPRPRHDSPVTNDSCHLVIGVDGGGTKTVAWLAPLDDPANTIVLGRGQAGPGNPRAAGFDIAQANIAAAIAAAFADAEVASSRRQLPPASAWPARVGNPSRSESRPGRNNGGIAAAVRVARRRRTDSRRRLARELRHRSDLRHRIARLGPQSATGQTARCGGWGYLARRRRQRLQNCPRWSSLGDPRCRRAWAGDRPAPSLYAAIERRITTGTYRESVCTRDVPRAPGGTGKHRIRLSHHG